MFVSKEKIKTCLQNLINKDSTHIWDSRGVTLYKLKRVLVDRNRCPFGGAGCKLVCSKLFTNFNRYWYSSELRQWMSNPRCGCEVANAANIPIENLDYILEYMITLIETGEVKNEKTGNRNW